MKLVCVDLFCGAGGASAGLIEAAAELGLEIELIAINHWPTAIRTHSANYPWARHICARLNQVCPRDVVRGGRVHLLIAGPECTHHSIARGGRPIDDQKRVPAWDILPWLADLYVDNLIIENVPEFRSWSPLGANGKPLKSREGETYQAFLQAIRAHGYNLDERLVVCADYGDFTLRKRLFIQGVRRGAPTFPVPTHGPEGNGMLMFQQPWRPASEIIDWSLVGQSIFSRKKPLVPKTLRRIGAGMLDFNGIDIRPYLTGPTTARPETTSMGTSDCPEALTLEGVPFMVAAGGPEGKGRQPQSVERPLGTVLAENHQALVRPFLVVVNHGDQKVTGSNEANGNFPPSARCHSVDKPVLTITAKNGWGLVQPFLTKYYGTSVSAQSVNKPLDAVTAKQRFALVEPAIVSERDPKGRETPNLASLIPLGDGVYLDIRFRMLQWHELAGAQGFPKGYVFVGNKATKVRQIGNAVPRYTAKALCMERLKAYVPRMPQQDASLAASAAC